MDRQWAHSQRHLKISLMGAFGRSMADEGKGAHQSRSKSCLHIEMPSASNEVDHLLGTRLPEIHCQDGRLEENRRRSCFFASRRVQWIRRHGLGEKHWKCDRNWATSPRNSAQQTTLTEICQMGFKLPIEHNTKPLSQGYRRYSPLFNFFSSQAPSPFLDPPMYGFNVNLPRLPARHKPTPLFWDGHLDLGS